MLEVGRAPTIPAICILLFHFYFTLLRESSRTFVLFLFKSWGSTPKHCNPQRHSGRVVVGRSLLPFPCYVILYFLGETLIFFFSVFIFVLFFVFFFLFQCISELLACVRCACRFQYDITALHCPLPFTALRCTSYLCRRFVTRVCKISCSISSRMNQRRHGVCWMCRQVKEHTQTYPSPGSCLPFHCAYGRLHSAFHSHCSSIIPVNILLVVLYTFTGIIIAFLPSDDQCADCVSIAKNYEQKMKRR